MNLNQTSNSIFTDVLLTKRPFRDWGILTRESDKVCQVKYSFTVWRSSREGSHMGYYVRIEVITLSFLNSAS